MRDKRFYFNVFVLSTVLLMLLITLIVDLAQNWADAHYILFIGYFVIALFGISGMAKRKEWSTKVMLIFFSVFAFDGLYIFSQIKDFRVILLISVAIISLYYVAKKVNIYKRKSNIIKILDQAKALEQVEKEALAVVKKNNVKKASDKKTLEFYDIKTKSKFKTNNYVTRVRGDRKFAVAKGPKGNDVYRILGLSPFAKKKAASNKKAVKKTNTKKKVVKKASTKKTASKKKAVKNAPSKKKVTKKKAVKKSPSKKKTSTKKKVTKKKAVKKSPSKKKAVKKSINKKKTTKKVTKKKSVAKKKVPARKKVTKKSVTKVPAKKKTVKKTSSKKTSGTKPAAGKHRKIIKKTEEIIEEEY